MRVVFALRDILLTASILLLIGLIAVRLDTANEDIMAGHVRVVDGDTLVMGGKRIRLLGIDAPELQQVCHRNDQPWACGVAAKDRLTRLTDGGDLRCTTRERDRYGRLLAVCLAGGLDLNAALVSDGYAVAFGDYDEQEEMAKARRLGLWGGTFDLPQEWRRSHGSAVEDRHGDHGLLLRWGRRLTNAVFGDANG